MGDHGWVRETRFGVWFQGTEIWRAYVLAPALAQLRDMLVPEARRPGRLLDAGCGDGGAFPLLEELFTPETLVGIDIDADTVERARRMTARCDCAAETHVADLTKLPFEDASIDVVICHQTLHHVSDQAATLAEFLRVLRPGGVLLLAESCRCFVRSWWVRAFFRHPMQVQRSAGEYVDALRNAGFEVGASSVVTASPWWSRWDLGMRERLGHREPFETEPTQILVAAVHPEGSVRAAQP